MGTLSLTDFEAVKIPVPWGHISGRWYGNRKERPILAIHGWLDNLGTFDRLIPLLPDYVGVLCIDLPGHGRSSHLQPGMYYSVYDYVFIIPLVMKEYGWSKVSLIGHSLGGVLCFVYASLAPHTVDMIVSLDILLPLRNDIDYMALSIEKQLLDVERQKQGNYNEPPSYTHDQLGKVLAKGSYNSVSPKLAKHLLHRQLTKSKLYPERFYFSRDIRVKYYHYMDIDDGLGAEMARQIRKKPYLIIKGSLSPYLSPRSNEAISILAQDNPHFEFYEVEGGTHHLHLHAAEECASYIVPFIQHHRPPALTSWTLNGKEENLGLRNRRGFFNWSKKKRSKL
ncbi:probable serine hydrolase [Drosophila takahashii]|uniref:probable serine hydrolase n=1 Tax=Drosophila takahashii TaxID=29030 RepID=UPI001CF8F57F|nr:probable serine hydrolase [Drosophila takahashii]